MSHPQRPNDPRIPEIIKHLKILARRHDRKLVVKDYLEYRAKHVPSLPALTTVYRLLNSWSEALEAAGVESSSKTELSRTSDEALIAALKQAAEALNVQILSSHAYDEYRRTYAPDLPSSAVIRKWLGRWAQAVKLAGLETTGKTTPRRPTMIEIIEALRKAKAEIPGMMTARSYADFYADLTVEERDDYPEISHVLTQFPSWDAALQAADVEQSDALHPLSLWTAEEARRIALQVEKVTGQPLTPETYNFILSRTTRPMPSWEVLSELLAS